MPFTPVSQQPFYQAAKYWNHSHQVSKSRCLLYFYLKVVFRSWAIVLRQKINKIKSLLINDENEEIKLPVCKMVKFN